MFWVMLLVGGAIWAVARVGDKTRPNWMLRNFFFRIVFFAGLAASFSRGGSYIQIDTGKQLALIFGVWFFWIIVIGIPATIIYYFLKVRRLRSPQEKHSQSNLGYLTRLFQPREVRITLGAAKAFFSQTPGLTNHLVLPRVLELIKDTDKTMHSITVDGINPDHLMLMLTTNVIGCMISNGEFHSYRGILNYQGQDLRRLWLKANSAMVDLQFIDKTTADKDNLWLFEQIRNAG